MPSVCVYCGSRVGANPAYAEAARELGRVLAELGYPLVFGGGHIGLMGVVADAVLQHGGSVVGVIPRALMEKELAHTGLTELHIVETMHQRKALMADRADIFCALPGGYGTAEELFEMLTWRQLGIHACPIGLLNTEGYFDPLLAWLDRMVEDDLLKTSNRNLLHVSDDPRTLLDTLSNAECGMRNAE